MHEMLEGIHVKPFQVHKMEMNLKGGAESERLKCQFSQSGKGFGFTRDP
jgi:hypothetical protein